MGSKGGWTPHGGVGTSRMFHRPKLLGFIMVLSVGVFGSCPLLDQPPPSNTMWLEVLPSHMLDQGSGKLKFDVVPVGRFPCLYLFDENDDEIPDSLMLPGRNTAMIEGSRIPCAVSEPGYGHIVLCEHEGQVLLNLWCRPDENLRHTCSVDVFDGNLLSTLLGTEAHPFMPNECKEKRWVTRSH